MATRLYGINVGDTEFDVIENVGSAASSAMITFLVDIATNLITDGSTTRGPSKEEVLLALEQFKAHIVKGDWPPA